MSNLNRETLLAAVTLARPALATQMFVPAFTHYLFRDDEVTAYNDLIGISVTMEHDLSVCLPGDLLNRVLNSLAGQNVMVQPVDGSNTLLLSSGRSRLKVPFLPVEDFPIRWPDIGKLAQMPLNVDVFNGIRLCLPGVGVNPNHPAQMGVTLDTDKDGTALLWSTDSYSLSRYQTEVQVELPGDCPVIMPTAFCEQLLALAKAFPKEEVVLCAGPGVLVASFGRRARLQSRTAVDLQPLDFQGVWTRHLAGAGKFQPIPVGWDDALARLLVVLSSETAKTATLDAGKGSINMVATSAMGEAQDELEWPGNAMARPVSVDPALLARGSKAANQMAFCTTATLFKSSDGSFSHMVAHCATRAPAP